MSKIVPVFTGKIKLSSKAIRCKDNPDWQKMVRKDEVIFNPVDDNGDYWYDPEMKIEIELTGISINV